VHHLDRAPRPSPSPGPDQVIGSSPLDRRHLLKLFGAIAAVGAVGGASACATGQAPAGPGGQPIGPTIKLGLVTPALGVYAGIGDDIQKGFQLYLANNENLLGLSNVDLKLVEEGPTPQSASAAVKGLLDSGVVVIAGVANPDALPVLAPMMLQAQVPLICSNLSPDTLVNPDYLWRASSVEGEAGRAVASYAFADGPKAYLFYEDTAAARSEVSAFRRAYTDLGGVIVGDVFGKVNFAKSMGEARTRGANVIYGGYTGADALSLLNAFGAAGLGEVKMVGPGSLTETVDLDKFNPLPRNVFTSSFYASDLDNDDNRRFVTSYHKAQGVQPSPYAAAAYDSAALIDKALRSITGAPTAAALNASLGQLGEINSPRGFWTFNVNRTPQQRWYLRQLRLDGMVPANLLDTDLTVLG
jgi:branched-chain amino acid transport system substrate-binding protein